MSNVFVLLIGASGVGKTTIADYMERNLGLKQIKSYTTRPPRYEGEVGHIFISKDDVEKYPNKVAENDYAGNYYFATQEQVDECDVYVINPGAVEQFKKNYRGNKTIKVVLLEDTPTNICKHMLMRGDSIGSIFERLNYDRHEFKNARNLADYIIANRGIDKTAWAIRNSIKCWDTLKGEKSHG